MKVAWVAMVVIAMVAGCAARPPDSVALSLYARNLSDSAFAFTVLGGDTHQAVQGELGDAEPRSYGCAWVGHDWGLVVTEGIEPPAPADDFVATTSAEEHSGRAVAIWLEAQPDGEVVVGGGVPSWWSHEEQHC